MHEIAASILVLLSLACVPWVAAVVADRAVGRLAGETRDRAPARGG